MSQNAKPFWTSKTLWANAIGALVIYLDSVDFILSPEDQAGILVVINIILRVITKQPVSFKGPANNRPLGTAAAVLFLAMLFIPIGCSTLPPGYGADLTPGNNGEHYVAVGDGSSVAGVGDRSAVRTQIRDDGVFVGFDLLGMKNYQASEWAQDTWGPLKLFSYPIDYVGYMAVNHPWQTLTGVFLVSEYTGITNELDLPGESRRSAAPVPQDDRDEVLNLSIDGDGNNVFINVDHADNHSPTVAPPAE